MYSLALLPRDSVKPKFQRLLAEIEGEDIQVLKNGEPFDAAKMNLDMKGFSKTVELGIGDNGWHEFNLLLGKFDNEDLKILEEEKFKKTAEFRNYKKRLKAIIENKNFPI